MKRGTTYLQGYNCQIAVDGANQVIVALLKLVNAPLSCDRVAAEPA
jgi:hypothetical protein